jgi:hypothetical protein
MRSALGNPAPTVPPRYTGFSLCAFSQNGIHRLKPVLLNAPVIMRRTPSMRKYLCCLSLARFALKRHKKTPVFPITYAPPPHVSSCVAYHLRKKEEGEGREVRIGAKSFVALLLPALFPVSPLLHYSYKKMGGV